MLGERIGEIRGHNIGMRILPDEGRGPRMEVTDRGMGTLYGVHVTSTGTYVTTMRSDGTIAGGGTGTVVTEDGELATFKADGVGHFTRPGVMSWRGAMYYETTSSKLARLNGMTVVYETEIDESGKSEDHLYEWK
jgi:hypothetical protein